MTHLEEDEKGVMSTDTLGDGQKMTIRSTDSHPGSAAAHRRSVEGRSAAGGLMRGPAHRCAAEEWRAAGGLMRDGLCREQESEPPCIGGAVAQSEAAMTPCEGGHFGAESHEKMASGVPNSVPTPPPLRKRAKQNPLQTVDLQGVSVCTPGRIRTCDLQSRSLTLYPTELRAHRCFAA